MVFVSALLLLVSSGVLALPPFVPRPSGETPTTDEYPPDDVILRKSRLSVSTIEEQVRDALAGKLYKDHRWPNRTLYFFIDDSFSTENSEPETLRKLNIFVKVLDRISKSTCINFVEDKNQQLKIRVLEERMNGPLGAVNSIGVDASSVGADTWLKHHPDHWDVTGNVVMHEVIHSLGFDHTHDRIDRNHYITDPKEGHAVQKSTFGFVPYDLGSIMHYDMTNKIIDPKYKHTRSFGFPSFLDFKALNMLYDCQEYCPEKASAKCQNGGYPNPRDCSKCNCPLGYGGPVCDQRPKGCGEILNATDSWQTVKWTVNSAEDVAAHLNSEYQEVYTVFCTHWIQAPKDRKIEVKLGKLGETKGKAKEHCKEDGIEIKILPDPSLTNPRHCMNVVVETEIKRSALNPTPIISWTGRVDKEFEITFRHVPNDLDVVL